MLETVKAVLEHVNVLLVKVIVRGTLPVWYQNLPPVVLVLAGAKKLVAVTELMVT